MWLSISIRVRVRGWFRVGVLGWFRVGVGGWGLRVWVEDIGTGVLIRSVVERKGCSSSQRDLGSGPSGTGRGIYFSPGILFGNEMIKVPAVEKRVIVRFLLHYRSLKVNQLIIDIEKHDVSLEGFVINTPILASVGVPLEINRNAFGCHVSVPWVPF